MVGGGESKKKNHFCVGGMAVFLELHIVSVKPQLEHKQCTIKVVNKLGFRSRYFFSDIKLNSHYI